MKKGMERTKDIQVQNPEKESTERSLLEEVYFRSYDSILQLLQKMQGVIIFLTFFGKKFIWISLSGIPRIYNSETFRKFYLEMKHVELLKFLCTNPDNCDDYIPKANKLLDLLFEVSPDFDIEIAKKWSKFWNHSELVYGVSHVGNRILRFLSDYLKLNKIDVSNPHYSDLSKLTNFLKFLHERLEIPMEQISYSRYQLSKFNEEIEEEIYQVLERGEKPFGYREMTDEEKRLFEEEFE